MTHQDLSNFTHWLHTQTARQDPVGDLARDVAADHAGRSPRRRSNPTSAIWPNAGPIRR